MSITFPATTIVTTVTTTATGDLTITNVVLQLHGDGIAASTNSNFIDSSTNNFTITRAGTPTQGSVNPFGSSWSNYFDGSTGFLSYTQLAALSGDFTLECWINIPSNPSVNYWIWGYRNGADTSPYLFINSSGAPAFGGDVTTFLTGSSLSLNQWHHIAVSRTGVGSNNLKLFIDGVLSAQSSTTQSFTYASSQGIGKSITSTAYFFSGYISNFRIINGTGIYTTAFTPSTTPLTTATNTQLLTAATNRFQDISTVSNAITANGTVSVQRFAPFPALPATAYTTSTYSGSVYFNGSTDYLTIPNTSALNFTGSFTVEGWFYFTALSGSADNIFYNKLVVTPSLTGIELGVNAAAKKLYAWINGAVRITGNTTIVTNTWYHFAISQNASNLYLFVNGVSDASPVSASSDSSTAAAAFIAAQYNAGPRVTGYISNFRILNGQALYTANFTPSTQPLTTSSQGATSTVLLLQGTNAGIVDTTMQNNLVTVGSAQISTATVKYGSGSIYFNGSGSYLTAPTSTGFAFANNFTVEFWVYPTTFVQYGCMFDTRTVNSNATGLYIRSQATFSSGQWQVSNGTASFNISASSNLTASSWQHVALVRSGTTLTLYLNGTSVGSATVSQNFSDGGLRIASAIDGYQFAGYIDDLRVTNGVARYTATFTPPTAAFPDIIPSITTATTTSTLATGYTFSTSTYLGTEIWTWNTATQRWFSTQEPNQQYTLTPSLIEDQATTATGYIDFPYGTTAQRPQGPTPGYMRFNTDLGLMEYWNTAGTWVQIPAQNT